jgi:hypothetical protein
MSDAFAESELLEERSLELREHGQGPELPDGVDEADALDQRRDLVGGADDDGPVIADDVNEADAIDQATPVAFDDDEDWREG